MSTSVLGLVTIPGMSPADPQDPLSNNALEHDANAIAKIFRVVKKKAPQEIQRTVRLLLAEVHGVVRSTETSSAQRLDLARRLESLLAELRGRSNVRMQFYTNGRLGVILAYDPIIIRECINDLWVSEHIRRFEERARRGMTRLNYFFERCGLKTEEEPEVKPWNQPYYHLQEDTEFLWRKKPR
jgi:hypothetical protein